MKFLKNLFIKKANQVSDQKEKHVIKLKHDDLLEQSKNKFLRRLTMADFKHKCGVNEAHLITYQSPDGHILILRDKYSIFSNMPRNSIKEGDIIFPMTESGAKEFLVNEGYINIFWSREDVENRIAYIGADASIWEIDRIIEYIGEAHDASVGLSYDLIDEAINYVINDEEE